MRASTLPHRRNRIRDLDRPPRHIRVQALQRVCSLCSHKAKCDRDLADGTAAENSHGYCGNASTLESLDRAGVAPH
ncbi:hypothetical protein [Bradyrhizobium sp. 1]|uniref:hypothetical protein n=1 Tax=Bradyrhizobium sp. 1 TaxID=241591 RepID=UPI001FFAD6A3|nr:hypothetical protein [Bradyrhizobium sp. 1]MCK1389749.1 hypothetical protein [Bradyrhizobium sp. 1]